MTERQLQDSIVKALTRKSGFLERRAEILDAREQSYRRGLKAGIRCARSAPQTEKQLQDSIAKILAARGIFFVRSRMDKRTTNNVGLPDFLLAIRGFDSIGLEYHDCPIAWEVKLPEKKLNPAQQAIADKMRDWPNCWTHRVITSVNQAIKELEIYGL